MIKYRVYVEPRKVNGQIKVVLVKKLSIFGIPIYIYEQERTVD